MLPISLISTPHTVEAPTPTSNAPIQQGALANVTMMPPASFSEGLPQNAVFTPSGITQNSIQQPLLFSGNAGNFFFAQSPSVGGAPLILTQGQTHHPGAFVVAQPMPAGVQTPVNTVQTLHTAPTNCIFRLPDGRLVFSAQSPSSMGIANSSLPQLPFGQPAYFPVSISTAGPSPQQQQQVGLIGPNSNQAFYIQLPTTIGGFTGNMLTATSTPNQVAIQPQMTNSFLKTSQASGNSGSPMLLSSSLPAYQGQIAVPTKGSAPGNGSANVVGLPQQTTSCQQPPLQSGCVITNQLPNGSYVAVSCSTQSVPASSAPEMTPAKSVTAGARRQASASRSRQDTSAVTVLNRLDEQIQILQNMTSLSEAQAVRLKQLVDVREQLSKASPKSTTSTPNCASRTVAISLELRRELLDLLARNNLLPTANPPPISDTIVIEFRLNTQRYNIRLTKQQKSSIERLLYSVNSQRQAEILTVLQQEQAKVYMSKPRATPPSSLPSTTSSCSLSALATCPTPNASTQLRFPSPMHSFPSMPMHPATLGGSSGLRLVATRQVLPSSAMSNTFVRGASGNSASAPVMGLVTALAIPPMSGQSQMFAQNIASTIPSSGVMCSQVAGTNVQMGGIYLSSALTPGTQTFVMQQPVIISSSSLGPSTLAITSVSAQSGSYPQAGHATSLFSTEATQQNSRTSRLRACLLQDLKCAVDRPALTESSETVTPTPTQLLELLAPYHVQQDGDNTEEALTKVDHIIENASKLLLERKRDVLDAINARLCLESMNQMDSHLESRLLIGRMALDLERDVFQTERKEFSDALAELGDRQNSSFPSPALDVPQSNCDDLVSDNPTYSILQQRCQSNALQTTFLKHPVSIYPPRWSSLLGPLAFLRPLKFDGSSSVDYAPICFPDTDKPNSPSASLPFPPNVVRSSEADSSVDASNCCESSANDGEPDSLLGLNVDPSNSSVDHRLATANGMAHDRKEADRNTVQSSDEAAGFEETFDLWQELMREEGMDIEEMESDSCIDGASTSMLSDSISKKCGTLENGSMDSVQHSEDPDLDAAIRSILTSSH